MVAILAQGRGKSDFGRFPTFEYVRDVLKKSGRTDLDTLAESANYSVVLSAHSGGGSTKVVPILGAKEAETADRSALHAQAESATDKRVVNKLQPVDLVVLYEALNGDFDTLELVIDWVERQLDRLASQLDASPDKALAATPVLRGYYGGRRDSGYASSTAGWRADQGGDQARVPPAYQQDVADRFRVIEVQGPLIDPPPKKKGAPTRQNVEHEQVISGLGAANAGSIADALRASRDPTVDRGQAVVPDDAECKQLRQRARQREEARAKAAREAKEKAEQKAREKAGAPK